MARIEEKLEVQEKTTESKKLKISIEETRIGCGIAFEKERQKLRRKKLLLLVAPVEALFICGEMGIFCGGGGGLIKETLVEVFNSDIEVDSNMDLVSEKRLFAI